MRYHPCASFTKWHDRFPRHVEKGEKGINIIAPTLYKIKEERKNRPTDQSLYPRCGWQGVERGSFHLTTMTKELMEQAGYGLHHTSNDGTFHIMDNGTRAFVIRNEDNPLCTAKLSIEQNYNQIDGIINNQPTVAQLEADANSGKSISLMDLLAATRMEEKQLVMEQLKTKSP